MEVTLVKLIFKADFNMAEMEFEPILKRSEFTAWYNKDDMAYDMPNSNGQLKERIVQKPVIVCNAPTPIGTQVECICLKKEEDIAIKKLKKHLLHTLISTQASYANQLEAMTRSLITKEFQYTFL